MTNHSHRFCVAPMMEWTDRYDRFFMRIISKKARLYTEMLTANAVRFGDREKLLGFHAEEHPLALQLGGSEARALAEAAKIGEGFGYDEVNLNIGCPSPRVKAGAFGAVLMEKPALVAECIHAMQGAVSIPVTVKCRIGIDDNEPSEQLPQFITPLAEAGCEVFIIHARKAWLDGLSPKQNRDVPPLDYTLVHAMKGEFPHLSIILNGGITSLDEAEKQLQKLDGVMMGRIAYQKPYILADIDKRLFGEASAPLSRREIVEKLIPYIDKEIACGRKLSDITRHITGLYAGKHNA
ncbi:MAG: tRNA dihydrouridine(20/20a) synthase DusA, partial [Parvibaculales bacterium]